MVFIFSFLNVQSKFPILKHKYQVKKYPVMVIIVLLKIKIITQKEYTYIVHKMKKNKTIRRQNAMTGM
jgi:hypothetical protein